MHSLSIFGTSSDAGKSTLSFAITYLLHKEGVKVAPFKAQNVSNNSQVTQRDSGEIAIPQAFAADAIGLETRSAFNPILLKSGAKSRAHMIIDGKSVGDTDVWEYYRDMQRLRPIVKRAFLSLKEEFECIVAEGAGSPVELNLMDKDLSNIYVAEEFQTKIILVADIERGGVFASIYGVYNLLPKALQKRVIGVIVNKFRGDLSLFYAGRKIIETEFGIPVLGVVPYRAFNLGFEDSASLMHYSQKGGDGLIRVGVIKLPHISNFTDFEPLVVDDEISLRFITSVSEAASCDLLILPGSKRVVDDLLWIKEQGFSKTLQSKEHRVVAICGGYEMMFEKIYDPEGVESSIVEIEGLGRLKGSVFFEKEKIVQRGCYNLFGTMCDGYEIHNARTKKRAKKKRNLYGTFVHGLFDNDALRYEIFSAIDPSYKGYNFKEYKHNAIDSFAAHIERHVDMKRVYDALSE